MTNMKNKKERETSEVVKSVIRKGMPLELTLCPTREINRLTGTDLSGVDLFGA